MYILFFDHLQFVTLAGPGHAAPSPFLFFTVPGGPTGPHAVYLYECTNLMPGPVGRFRQLQAGPGGPERAWRVPISKNFGADVNV